MNKICEICGKDFHTPPSKYPYRKTCSRVCKNILTKQQVGGKNNPNYGKSKGYKKYLSSLVAVFGKCVVCGSSFRTKASHISRRKTCSKECQKEHYKTSLKKENNPNWRGGIAKWKYSSDWRDIIKQVRKRDNYTCQVCKKKHNKISKSLHVHHIDGNKLNNDFSNLVCVCQKCHPMGEKRMKEYIASL